MDICPNSLDHAGWKEEGLLDAVLEELSKLYNDENFIRKCKKMTRYSINQKKQFILENAPFSLLTAGWVYKTNTKSKIQNPKNVDVDKQKGYWEKFEGKSGEGKLSYLIYRKSEK